MREISAGLLDDADYQTAIALAKIVQKDGDEWFADLLTDMAQGGELHLSLHRGMRYCVEHDISVPYDVYKTLQSWFSHEDEPDWDPDLDDVADSDEAEVFKKLKIADE